MSFRGSNRALLVGAAIRRASHKKRTAAVALCCIFLGQVASFAGTTWTGGGTDPSWGTSGNWGGTLPLFNGTEAITIGSGFASGATLNLNAARYINSLSLSSATGFTIAGGTNGSLNLRSGNITRVDNGTKQVTQNGQTISSNIVLGDPTGVAAYTGVWTIDGANGLTVTGNISEAGGSRGLTITNTQANNTTDWVRLSGTNTFSGGLTITQGLVYVSSDSNLGAASGGLTLNGGALDVQGNMTSARNITLTAASALYADSGYVAEFTGAISGSQNLTLNNGGTGTVILSGSGSNGTGIFQIWGGVASVRGSVGIGTGILEIANGGVLELGNGNLTRPVGTGTGQVWIGISGNSGFAAWGADRIVNLGGAGATMVWGTTSGFTASGSGLLFGSATSNATLDFQNAIDLGTTLRTVAVARGTGSGAEGKLSGVLSGAGGGLNVAKNGTEGRLLVTNGNNSYSGSTIVQGGELWVGANATSGAGNTALGSSTAAVQIGIITGADNASLKTYGGVTIGRNISVISGNTGIATLGGATADASTFSGTITLGSTTSAGHNLSVSAVGGGIVTVSGVIADPAGLTGTKGILSKEGAGTVVLSGANTYGGTTIVNRGVLNLRNSAALGSTASGTTVSNGAEIQLQGAIAIGAESLTLNGTGAGGSGALRNMSGNNSWAGNITLGSNSLIQSWLNLLTLSGTLGNGNNGADFEFGGAGDILVSGVITNNADVVKSGTGTLTLAGANTYTGASIVNSGTLRLTGSLNGATGTALMFGGDGTFDFNAAAGRAQGMGALTFNSGDGNVQSTYGGSGNTSLTFASFGAMPAGATGNFIISGGANGTTNKIVVQGLPAGVINSATFFNGNDYAYVDPAGFIRAINYGVDPGTAVSAGGVELIGDHVKANGHITSQGTQRFDTLHIASNIQYTIGANQKVTVNGILKTGNVAGGATILGGDYLKADPNVNMTIRTALQNDFLTITTPIIANGTNALTKTGSGTLTLSGVNTYTGGTYVTDGTLQLGASERLLSTGALTVAGGTFDLQNFTETVGGVVLASGAINGAGAGTLIGSYYDVRSGSASAILAGTASLTKSTDDTVTLTGANTYTGTTTVNGGTLVAASTTGGALAGTSSVTINQNGNLALGASNQINDTAPVVLAGGTLSKGNFSEGSSSAAGMGTLSLTADSRIDFGTGTVGTLAFAVFNPGSSSLLIDNWTGTPGSVGDATTDRLIFATDPTANLASFIFTGYDSGAVAWLLAGGYYEVTPGSLTPVPEMNPAVLAGVLCLVLGLFVHRRRMPARAARH